MEDDINDDNRLAPTILLIEEQDDAVPVEFILDHLGYKVMLCHNPGQALMFALQSRYDMILLNVELVRFRVAELIKDFRSQSDLDDTLVVVVTSFSEENELLIARCINAGADDFLSLDILETTIASRLAKILEWKTLRERERRYVLAIEEQRNILQERKNELEKFNELKNKFIGMAAHDLRNPLVSIRGFSEIMLDEQTQLPADEKRELLKIIFDTSNKMLSMVNDMLDVSVIESGHLELHLTPGCIAEVVRKRMHINEAFAVRKNICLATEFLDEGECLFDESRITQVIDNLLTNAIKFSPPGSKVLLKVEKDEAAVSISVIDEGPGISKEEQKKLFHHFQKLSARPTGGESSTGLGLAIVKTLVDAHGGELNVVSSLGQGAAFTVRIPVVT